MIPSPKRLMEELGVPHLKRTRWGDCIIQVQPPDNSLRSWLIINLLPYFWDSEISFDLVVSVPKKRRRHSEFWKYEWSLTDLDNHVLKNGKDVIELSRTTIAKDWVRKQRAIYIGNLHPNKEYKLSITFTDEQGGQSNPLQPATFTVKDRDEIYMQIFVALVVIFMGIIIGVISKGCSL